MPLKLRLFKLATRKMTTTLMEVEGNSYIEESMSLCFNITFDSQVESENVQKILAKKRESTSDSSSKLNQIFKC